MGLLIKSSDFTGKYAIAQTSYSSIDSYIAMYEVKYLTELLGSELFELFKTDFKSVSPNAPQLDIYKNIYNVISKDDPGLCNELRYSEGMKIMLLGFVYWEYMKEDKFKPTPSGVVVGQSEVNREAGFTENNIYEKYNNAVKSYCTIQWYIRNNSESYPTFNGIRKSLSYWI